MNNKHLDQTKRETDDKIGEINDKDIPSEGKVLFDFIKILG